MPFITPGHPPGHLQALPVALQVAIIASVSMQMARHFLNFLGTLVSQPPGSRPKAQGAATPGDAGAAKVYMTPVVSGPVSTMLYGAATEVEVEGCSLV